MLFLIKLYAAFQLDLGIDEVYYWFYSTNLKVAYFDHPPLVAWSIALTTFNHYFHHEIFVRGLAIISFVVTGLLLYREVRDQFSRHKALLFISLYSICIYLQYIGGMMMLPDAPLLLFSGLFFFGVLRWHRDTTKNKWLIFAAIMAGLCFWSKYIAILWPMVFISGLFWKRKIQPKKALYFGLIVTIIIAPLLLNNLVFVVEQLDLHTSKFALSNFSLKRLAKAILGDIFYMNPAVFFIVSRALWSPWKMTQLNYLLLGCSIPLIVLLWSLSLFNPTLPHWSGPAYLPLILFTSINTELFPVFKLLRRTVLALVILSTLSIIEIHQGYFLNSLSTETQKEQRGQSDGSLDIYGWEQLGRTVDLSNKNLVINHYYPGSHLHYYVLVDNHQNLYPYGNKKALHEYSQHPNYNQSIPSGSYFIESSRYPRVHYKGLQNDYDLTLQREVPILRRQDTVMIYKIYTVDPKAPMPNSQ